MSGSVRWSDNLTLRKCNDQERVPYAAGQLRGAALGGWESYGPRGENASHWARFRERFGSHHVLAGIMKMKKKEFLSLETRGTCRLARYAPTKLREDGDKREHFLEGLNDNL
ncbi:hypothetical protein U9M48_043090 [Paspalum notatum var. saurae]|uniref:Uncharacterized protein n=1 Tax=Paspalum notatum var. saurae TaxID=547442 RepID=A0AAQ3UTY4_PASNO